MGVIWSLLKIPTPVIVHKTVSLLAVLATPMGLMAMGAAFKFQGFSQNIKPIIVCSVMKLVVFVVLFMPFAIYLGFTESKLVAALIMLGSATTVSCYIMARSMGHDGNLTAGTVMLNNPWKCVFIDFLALYIKMFELSIIELKSKLVTIDNFINKL